MPVPRSPFLIALVCFAALLCAFGALVNSQTAPTLRRITTTSEEGLNLNPSISGDGSIVTFETTEDAASAGGTERFRAVRARIDTASTQFAQMAATRAPAPAISQTGAIIAFDASGDPLGSNANGNSEIFLYDATANLLRQITTTSPGDISLRGRNGNFQPSISDDGRFIAFASNRDLTGANADFNFEIFLYDALAGTFTQITNTTGIIGSVEAKISGDASRIAFIRDAGAPPDATAPIINFSSSRDLSLFDRQTSATRIIAASVSNLAFTFGRAISDDGARIVYAATTAANTSQVFLFDDRNGGAVRQLTSLSSRVTDVPLHPSISGDGARITFATRRTVSGTGTNSDGSVELYLFNLPTSQISRLTNVASSGAVAEVISSLSDDGTRVAFNFPRTLSGAVTNEDFAGNSEIYVIENLARNDTSDDLTILNGASFGREPSVTKAVAPDSIAVALGNLLALQTVQSSRQADGTFPRVVAGTTVTVNNRAAQIFFVSPAQVNFLVPAETEIGQAQVVVTNANGFQTRGTVTILRAAPGTFTTDGDGQGEAIALDAETGQRSPFETMDAQGNPRRIIIFTTGARNAGVVSVTINNISLAVESVTASPDMPGLDQITVRLDPRLSGAGSVPLIVRADGRESNTTTITFGGRPVPTTITLAPASTQIAVGGNVRFTATVRDANGNVIPAAQVNFSSSDTNIATIDADGMARGVSPGTVTITATSGNASTTAELRVVEQRPRTIVINEVLADPPDGAAGDANRDGVRSATQDEFVEIVNATSSDLDISGYQILTRTSAGAGIVRHTFAADTILQAGTAAIVFGGAGSSFNPNDPAFGGAIVVTASTGGLSLLNSGSTVTLRDAAGATLDEFTYGGATGLNGDANQSLTRSPDVTGDFTLHGAAANNGGRVFSPGTRTDGTPFAPSPAIARIEVSPSSASILTGAQQQFTARAFDANNQELTGVRFSWQSSNTSVATINADGLATGVAAGTTEITASARGVRSAPATLTVREPEPVLTRIELTPASATIGVGDTQAFTARAFDQNNNELSGVTFTFNSSDESAATINGNGLATGISPGATSITASANGVTSNAATLTVNQAQPRPARVEVMPASATINRGGAQQFTARAFDANNVEITGLTFAWTSSNDAVASVDNTGLARGLGVGTAMIRASVSDGRGGTITGEATLNVLVPLVINEILADVPPDDANTTNIEGDANRDGVRSAGDDEFIEIVNNSSAPVDISGVIIADATSNRFTFPASTTLAAGQAAIVFGGGNPPANDPNFGGALVFTTSSLSLNDGGDTVTIKLPVAGADVTIATIVYGGTGSAPAPSDQSLTRSPDVETGTTGGDFIAHTAATNAAGRRFSPGTRADGTPFGSPPVTRIEVAPASASINVGGAQVFMARAFSNAGGTEVEIQNVSFIFDSSDATVAILVPQTGQSATATGRAAGAPTIRAQAGGQAGAATLTVNAVVASIELVPEAAGVRVGESQTFTATARDANNQIITGLTFNFSLRNPSPANAATITATTAATVTVRGDNAGSVTIVAGYTRPSDNVTIEDTSQLTITNLPAISINDASVTEGNAGATSATFTVTLSAASAQEVRVDFATANGTAIAPADYQATSGTLIFAAGETSKTIVVTVNGDTLVEPDETFTVNLSNPVNAAIADASGAGTITNDDAAQIVISQVYGGGGNAGAPLRCDFVEIFNRGATTIDFSVMPYSIQYAGATANFGSTSASNKFDLTTGTIAPGGYFLIKGACGANGADFTADLMGGLSLAATAGKVALVGGIAPLSAAMCPTDATIIDLVGYGATANCFEGASPAPTPSNTTSVMRAGGGCQDTNDNAADFTTLSPAPRNTSSPVNDCNAPVPAISIDDVTVTEGNAGATASATFTVTLSTATTRAVTVDFATADNTATSPADYQAATGALTFNAGETSKTITINVNGDDLDEANETFFVNLTNARNATLADNQGVGTITDDDAAPTLSINDSSIAEGNAGATNLTFTITLSAASGQVVTVLASTADGTATAPGDYQAITNQSVTFAPGETTKTLIVSINGDTANEPDETLTVTLSGATNATIADSQGTGTITNDDAAGGLSINDVTVTEGNAGTTNATFTVTLSVASAQEARVNYATADGTATAGTDYQSASGTLIFAAGETSKTITVVVNGDAAVEPDETFFVNLSGATNATITDAQGMGTITNDDAASVAPMLVISQVYGGGGLTSATHRNDFIEIFNRGSAPVTLDGYTVQYASGNASTWTIVATLSGTLQPGQYFLIKAASGGSAGATFTADVENTTVNLAQSAGKVALVNGTTALTGTCPGDDGVAPFNPNNASIVDFVGYGSASSVNCSETSPEPAPANNTVSVTRMSGGCTDTGNNSNDFERIAPNPRNNSSTLSVCP